VLIPPKPPYHAGPSSVTQTWQHTRPKNHRQASSPTNENETTTSNLRQGWAVQHDATVICDSRLRWEDMRVFYSNIQLWPTRINPSPQTEGVSPLVRTMLHSPSADTWLPTYAWCKQQANLTTGTDGTTDSDPAQTPLLSQATWHKRKATAWFLQPIRTANPSSYTRQLKTLAKPRNHFFLDPQKTKLELSPTRRQWEDMQEYHSSINLWPSTKWPNLIRLEGGSPLVWTMLHPPATVARCLTYSWNGHLDNFVPWESNQTNGTE